VDPNNPANDRPHFLYFRRPTTVATIEKEDVARVDSFGPWHSAYFASYFTITGLHGAHVLRRFSFSSTCGCRQQEGLSTQSEILPIASKCPDFSGTLSIWSGFLSSRFLFALTHEQSARYCPRPAEQRGIRAWRAPTRLAYLIVGRYCSSSHSLLSRYPTSISAVLFMAVSCSYFAKTGGKLNIAVALSSPLSKSA